MFLNSYNTTKSQTKTRHLGLVKNAFGKHPRNRTKIKCDCFVQCKECLEEYKSLQSHLRLVHKISVSEYRTKYGVGGESITCNALRIKFKKQNKINSNVDKKSRIENQDKKRLVLLQLTKKCFECGMFFSYKSLIDSGIYKDIASVGYKKRFLSPIIRYCSKKCRSLGYKKQRNSMEPQDNDLKV